MSEFVGEMWGKRPGLARSEGHDCHGHYLQLRFDNCMAAGCNGVSKLDAGTARRGCQGMIMADRKTFINPQQRDKTQL
ncbi:hypothetical protein CSC3H3_14100 [Thalassospira marina]|uniref:Uncharacterized protein n=1 Tax=Thalassospira marina TaxID=2048283 RepID=A0ABM6QB50_9PROT|nr:hypothetical protein CSC3H3_14100 [Thalassospira marina]